VIGVDWGDETRWVLVGRTTKNKFYVIDTGVFDDIDTMKHVEKLKLIVSRENPKWIICDAGYGKTRNQILMDWSSVKEFDWLDTYRLHIRSTGLIQNQHRTGTNSY